MATSSPTKRTFPIASAGCSETLNPFNPDNARIGLTPAISLAVKAAALNAGGIVIPRM